jgi:3-deoxy-7-phosphoheptulonate synthase/chorismate mutase
MDNNNNLIVKKKSFQGFRDLFDVDPPQMIAGPCAVESPEQTEEIAKRLVAGKIKFMRGGAYKPRTSPYDFQGLGEEGLRILDFVRKKYSLKVIAEILDPRDMELGLEYVDIIQIGSRNMSNTALLKEAGAIRCPVILKRGMMSTLSEFLLAAEYIAKGGNRQLILCERGIRTFESSVRNVLDIASVAIIKKETSLPVIVDLSHSLGRKDILTPVAKAVLALGADALMIETHDNPEKALSDAGQQLSFDELGKFLEDMQK